jgi:hypothetical protein
VTGPPIRILGGGRMMRIRAASVGNLFSSAGRERFVCSVFKKKWQIVLELRHRCNQSVLSCTTKANALTSPSLNSGRTFFLDFYGLQ